MLTYKLEIIKINDDVIATSVKWSEKSFTTVNRTSLDYDPNRACTNIAEGGKIPGTNFYNYLDGVGSEDSSGQILTNGVYYHYDENSYTHTLYGYKGLFFCYSNWKVCTDPSHHVNN